MPSTTLILTPRGKILFEFKCVTLPRFASTKMSTSPASSDSNFFVFRLRGDSAVTALKFFQYYSVTLSVLRVVSLRDDAGFEPRYHRCLSIFWHPFLGSLIDWLLYNYFLSVLSINYTSIWIWFAPDVRIPCHAYCVAWVYLCIILYCTVYSEMIKQWVS